MTRLSPDQQNMEIEKTTAAIEEAVPGYVVTLFRAPYGAVNTEVRDRVWDHHLALVWWSGDDEDYRGFSPDRLYHLTMRQAAPAALS
jgi:peptidoglycan/xylan/chitin deacetylase (PgdA/CDA1 family)